MGEVADSASGSPEHFMRAALQMAERGMAAGGPPVGACLVQHDRVVASGHNSVIGELDATAHAEISVIRAACRELRSLTLPDSTLYVTVEPCPMCLAASFYAGVAEIIYAAPISAMHSRTAAELLLPADRLFAGAERAPRLTGGLLAEDSLQLLQQWRGSGATS